MYDGPTYLMMFLVFYSKFFPQSKIAAGDVSVQDQLHEIRRSRAEGAVQCVRDLPPFGMLMPHTVNNQPLNNRSLGTEGIALMFLEISMISKKNFWLEVFYPP